MELGEVGRGHRLGMRRVRLFDQGGEQVVTDTNRFDPATNEWGRWRFAHGLFAALDLAQDKARGAEILTDWNPTDFARVW